MASRHDDNNINIAISININIISSLLLDRSWRDAERAYTAVVE